MRRGALPGRPIPGAIALTRTRRTAPAVEASGITSKPLQLALSSRTRLVSTICLAMFGSGFRIATQGTMLALRPTEVLCRMQLPVQEFAAAVRGMALRTHCTPRVGSGTAHAAASTIWVSVLPERSSQFQPGMAARRRRSTACLQAGPRYLSSEIPSLALTRNDSPYGLAPSLFRAAMLSLMLGSFASAWRKSAMAASRRPSASRMWPRVSSVLASFGLNCKDLSASSRPC